MTAALNDQSLDQIFRSARTPNGWADRRRQRWRGKGLFSGTRIQSNFICSIGYGDPASVFPRNPRLSFEEAGRWV
jgi:hypothetical protein